MSYGIPLFVNTYNSTIASAFSSSSTTLQVATTGTLPSSIPSGYFIPITLQDAATGTETEIVYATSISGSNLTVERAKENTTALNWNIGDLVLVGPTAGTVASVGSGSFYGADSGSANAYAATINSPMSAYYSGLIVFIKIANTNTSTTCTINLNSIGTANIVRQDGSAIAVGDILADQICIFVFDGTHFQLVNPRSSVAPSKNLASPGYTYLPGGLIMQWGSITFTPSSGDFYNGTISFPIAFPNNYVYVGGNAETKYDDSDPTTGGSQDVVIYYDKNTTGSSFRVDTNSANPLSGSHTINWLAIGY